MTITSFKKSLLASALMAGMAFASNAYAAKDAVVAIPYSIDSLDPYNTNSTLSQAIGKGWYEGLFEFNKDLEIKPLLATGYEVSPDGLVYTFKLREGVKFQDGTDFNAEAVKFNFDRVLDKNNALARFNQFKAIKTIEVVDPLTLKITLNEPFSAFINNLAHPSAMIISPEALKKYGKDINLHPVGTGRYQFAEWNPGQTVTMKKFDGYWNKDEPAKLDSLTFRVVSDNNTRAAVMQTGEAQFTYPVPFEQVDVLKKDDKIELVVEPSIILRYISMNTLVKPFDNPKVRQAINYAINKEALNKVAFNGYADAAAGVVPEKVEYSYKIEPWKYDVAKAKELLKEAGYPNGFESTLWSAYNDGTSVKAIQFIQQQLRQVGIKVSVEALEAGQRVQRVQSVKDPKDAQVRMYYAGWSASTGEANWALSPLLAGDAWPPTFNNTAYYKNDKVDQDLAAALKTTDKAEKAKLYADAQQQIWADAPWAFLNVSKTVAARNKKLEGFYVMPDGSYYFKNVELKD
ncbi:glutathione ABC transporter substrate-binding protein GsiB [Pelistega indica]|uniref:Glutathione-binding protein GsiB n=1 Tax=Pelistega indica TaxID=1414851 RepID=V8G911_9BURK|nr:MULTISPECIES: glutathione ABC transporter substrate-binding protein GsiB [Pelistega]ETD72187.1 glutathione ABC transporter substrate-binding protein GsiB [Pelistega indica]